ILAFSGNEETQKDVVLFHEVSTPKLSPSSHVPRGEGQSVLYVDDEESLVYLITRVLQRLGYRVAGFTDANEALAAFRSDPTAFEAVVTDLSMPSMSGIEFAEHVLSLRPEVPVVMT